ncbi:MAG: radical SAM protein [Thermoplasmatota archaeon]
MNYKCIQQNSLIKTITRDDTLFHGDYTIDPYQHCEFGCSYCDSTFDHTIYITKNASELLKKELPHHKKGRIIIGSVHDPYQTIEKKYEITRSLLQILQKKQIPIHILTKSTLILRDLDIFKKMNNLLITFSILSNDEHIWHLFEGKTPSPLSRLETMRQLTSHAKTGVAMIPIIPGITDTKNHIETLIKKAKKHRAKYFIHTYLELKGYQKTAFFNLIQQYYPHLQTTYNSLYTNAIRPSEQYTKSVNELIKKLCLQYQLPNKI